MRWGSKSLFNAEEIKIGKYGTGINTRILPIKLVINMPI
jgi:hypothetical protein